MENKHMMIIYLVIIFTITLIINGLRIAGLVSSIFLLSWWITLNQYEIKDPEAHEGVKSK